MILYVILTAAAIVLFFSGVYSLSILSEMDSDTKSKSDFQLVAYISTLFSTAQQTKEFRSRQRMTIWLFCLAMLAINFARYFLRK